MYYKFVWGFAVTEFLASAGGDYLSCPPTPLEC